MEASKLHIHIQYCENMCHVHSLMILEASTAEQSRTIHSQAGEFDNHVLNL